METITIPDDLAARLRARAAANRRSLDAEVASVLELAVADAETERKEADLRARIRAFRSSLTLATSGHEIARMVREDRDTDRG